MIGTWTMRTCHSRWDRRSGHAGLATPAVVVVIIFTVIGRLGIMDGGLRVTLRDMLGIIVRIFSVLTPSMTSIWSSRYLLSTWRKDYHYHIIIIMANRQSHREGKTRHHKVTVGSHDRHVVQHELPTQRILHLNCCCTWTWLTTYLPKKSTFVLMTFQRRPCPQWQAPHQGSWCLRLVRLRPSCTCTHWGCLSHKQKGARVRWQLVYCPQSFSRGGLYS